MRGQGSPPAVDSKHRGCLAGGPKGARRCRQTVLVLQLAPRDSEGQIHRRQRDSRSGVRAA